VYVPANYSTSQEWPVIVDLHGNVMQGDDALLPTRRGLADAIRARRDAYPVICVFPQAAKGQFWEQEPMQRLVMAELDHVASDFRIDPSRTYLTGYSMGAAGTYRLAFKFGDRFAAYVTGAGTVQPIPPHLGAQRAAQDIATNPFTATTAPFELLAAKIKNQPIWIFHGDSDKVVSIAQSQQLVAALKKAGGTVRFTQMPQTAHTEGLDRMWATPVLIDWLIAQHRPTKPSPR
jgi:predicted peptidase